jgi:hypothetical protein
VTINKDDPMYACLKKYLREVLSLEELQVMKALMQSFKALLDTYSKYLVIDKINAELENFLMSLKLDPFDLMLNSALGAISGVESLLVPTELMRCLGAADIMEKITAGFSKLKAGLGFAQEITDRYEIAGKIESRMSTTINDALEYVDALLGFIEEAVTAKAQGLGGP